MHHFLIQTSFFSSDHVCTETESNAAEDLQGGHIQYEIVIFQLTGKI